VVGETDKDPAAGDSIPEDLRRFILTSVPSVPFVEALLIFRDAEASAPGRAMTIEVLAHRLYVSDRQAADIVDQLRTASVVSPLPEGGGHRYAPGPDLAALIEGLARVYRTHLVETTALIHSRTGRMAQQFADAFKLRKD
jgi:hypothetical protein